MGSAILYILVLVVGWAKLFQLTLQASSGLPPPALVTDLHSVVGVAAPHAAAPSSVQLPVGAPSRLNQGPCSDPCSIQCAPILTGFVGFFPLACPLNSVFSGRSEDGEEVSTALCPRVTNSVLSESEQINLKTLIHFLTDRTYPLKTCTQTFFKGWNSTHLSTGSLGRRRFLRKLVRLLAPDYEM